MLNELQEKKLKVRAITIASLTIAIFLLELLEDYPKLVERYYSEGFYPFICHVLHPVFNLFLFSVGDIMLHEAVYKGYLIYALYRLIKLSFKKEFKLAGIFLMKIIIGVQIGILVFYLFWGMNYFRPSAGERLNMRDTNYTTADLKAITTMLIDSANASRARVTSC